MVINGAYPGGETCRLASIVWFDLFKKKSVHNIRNFAIKPRFPFGIFENYLDKLVINSTKSFIGVSQICSNSLKVRKNFSKLQNIHHIYNGVEILDLDTEKDHEIDLRSKLNLKNKKICLMLGTYEKRKGHQFLFEVFDILYNQNPDIHLVIAGDGKKKR